MAFHDWNDKFSRQLTRNSILVEAALKNVSQIVIHDHAVRAPGILSLQKERSVTGLDLVMKQ